MAITGKGASFLRDDGTGSFMTVGQVTGITAPGMSRETPESTYMGVPGDYKTFLSGLRDGGQATFTINFERGAYDSLKADFESDTLQTYAVTLPDADNTAFVFDGFITELPLDVPIGDRVTSDVTVKISGQPTIGSGV